MRHRATATRPSQAGWARRGLPCWESAKLAGRYPLLAQGLQVVAPGLEVGMIGADSHQAVTHDAAGALRPHGDQEAAIWQTFGQGWRGHSSSPRRSGWEKTVEPSQKSSVPGIPGSAWNHWTSPVARSTWYWPE